MKNLFTIGHSNLDIKEFIARLKEYHVDVLVDVRSSPYSRFHTQYNRETLKVSLQKENIIYLFLGKELGARSNDDSCYVNGKVRYDLLAKTPLFQEGLNRLKIGLEKYSACLMCAEQDPVDCHRMILVARNINDSDISINHILKDGYLEPYEKSVERLRLSLNLFAPELMRTEDELVEQAFLIQSGKIAYTEESLHGR